MLGANVVRLSARCATSLRSSLHARISIAPKQFKVNLPVRHYAAATATSTRTKRKPSSASKTTKKKAVAPKKKAAPKKKVAAPKKKKAAPKEKLKPWQARGADGKLRE